jgi:hypothetical protein
MHQYLIRPLMLAACAALATHGSAFAQVREVTPQPSASRPTMPNLPATVWDAFAISRKGRLFEQDNQSDELTARGQTRRACEQATGSRCRAIAVPHNYTAGAIWCDNGNGKVGGYLGGSSMGYQFDVAMQKSADDDYAPSDCKPFYVSRPSSN